MKLVSKILIIISLIFTFACSENEEITLKEPFGKQYYRFHQYDFDGTMTTYYAEKTVTNNNPRQKINHGNLFCFAEGIELFIGLFKTYIYINNDYHDSWMIVDGDTLNPNYCSSNACLWILINKNIEVNQFHITSNSYTWEGSAFDCDELTIPIELLSFNVIANNDGSNTIEIITASEINSDYIILERTPDPLSKEWEFVTKIKLKNDINGAFYRYIDK